MTLSRDQHDLQPTFACRRPKKWADFWRRDQDIRHGHQRTMTLFWRGISYFASPGNLDTVSHDKAIRQRTVAAVLDINIKMQSFLQGN